MKRNKKNNLFLKLTMVFAMFMFIVSPFSVLASGNLNATSLGINLDSESSCDSSTKYTVYYMFLDAQDENHSGTQTPGKVFNYGKVSSDYKTVALGFIDVKSDGGSSATSKTSWSFDTFYTKFIQAKEGNVSGSDYVYKDGTNYYAMSTRWIDNESQENNAFASTTKAAYIAASVDSTAVDTTISTFSIDAHTTSTIKRQYGENSSWRAAINGKTPATVSLASNPEWHPYFHPYLVYATFCKAGSNPSDPGDSSKVTLTYIENAGNDTVTNMPTPKSKTDDKGKDFTVDDSTPKRTGYAFQGWAESASGSVKYKANDVIKNLTADKKLYAVWEKVPEGGYKVEYDPNGGVGAPGSETAGPNECVTISSTKPTMSGAKFLGWSTNKGATSADSNYNPGKEYCGKNGDLKLFAVWSGGSATSNPKTGVADYAIAFGLLGAAAGAGLFISKRKNLFKQI